MSIHHISIIASSEASVAFYEGLGFRQVKRIERPYDVVVLMEGHGVGLELFIDPRHEKPVAEPLGLRTFSIQVDDFSHWSEGRTVLKDWFGERYFTITDPDGNVIQIHE